MFVMKALIWVVLFFIVVVGALVIFSKNSSSSTSGFALDAVSQLDHVKGNASSTVVLIEYSDFQCPACRTYYPIMRELVQIYGDKIALVYRHYPLKQIHINADPAAWSAEAAGKQGKFWEMHDLLFEKQAEWSSASASALAKIFSDYAILLGIDKEKFLADFDSREVKDFVNSQMQSAQKAGFNSTPTFVLNGKKIENLRGLEAFKLLIDKAMSF